MNFQRESAVLSSQVQVVYIIYPKCKTLKMHGGRPKENIDLPTTEHGAITCRNLC